MNILQFLKNGSGIHIKEKNKGSFTRWCGGNVTEECIRRGKASGNPKIRKKATFASNVRKWKHLQGGLIMQEGGKFNWGLLAVNAGSNLLSAISENTKASAEALKLIALNNIDFNLLIQTSNKINLLENENRKLRWQNAYKNGMTLDLFSNIVNDHLGYLNFASDFSKAWLDLKNKNKIAESELDVKKAENWGNAVSGIALYIFSSGILNLLGNKQKLNSTLNYNFLNNVNTAFKNFGTRNSDGTMNLGNGMGSVNLRTGLYNVQPLSLPYENNL